MTKTIIAYFEPSEAIRIPIKRMKITTEIKEETLKELLCSAFEGGSNYWYQIIRYRFGNTGLSHADFKQGGKMQNPQNYWHPAEIIPFTAGCSVEIRDMEGEKLYQLNREALDRGVKVMAEKYPKHFSAVISEDADATTADVFLQCCLFGEAIYG